MAINKHGNGFKHTLRDHAKDKSYLKTSFHILCSQEYRNLSPSARLLMQAIQMEHRTNRYTSYGYKQAMAITGYGNKTITKSFSELIKSGWLHIIENYNHTNGKTRLWELTWMSYYGKAPKDAWKKIKSCT